MQDLGRSLADRAAAPGQILGKQVGYRVSWRARRIGGLLLATRFCSGHRCMLTPQAGHFSCEHRR
jgi:hypothetical protein